ncbi:MAG: hypothetical protein K8T91_08200 [Planctomycetes bacterium]|nr:hypothetical protein [Planctomycetota bacterium]
MLRWELADGRRSIAAFETWPGLEELLTRLETEAAGVVYTLGPLNEEHFVQFGLSPEMCFLEFHPYLGASTTYVAREPQRFTGQSDDIFVFDYAGTPTELPISTCISEPALRAALREYICTGKRPNNVQWLEV